MAFTRKEILARLRKNIKARKPIIGAAIVIVARGQTIDSKGDPIDLAAFYRMGKQKTTGKVAIIKTEKL